MRKANKRRLRDRFFKEIGPNAEIFKAMFDSAPLLCIYMKDAEGRIMALNRRNCDVCNIKDEWDAIGLKSSESFPSPYAEDYMAIDREVLETTDRLLTDIAVETGFFDQSHLTRVFKKERGMTPGTYRRKHSLLKS